MKKRPIEILDDALTMATFILTGGLAFIFLLWLAKQVLT